MTHVRTFELDEPDIKRAIDSWVRAHAKNSEDMQPIPKDCRLVVAFTKAGESVCSTVTVEPRNAEADRQAARVLAMARP